MLSAALAAGLAAEGSSVFDLGVVPTPAVAWHSAREDLPGAVVSASHNPYRDNGIQFFAAGGRKLTDAQEAELDGVRPAPGSAAVGVVRPRADTRPYAAALVDTLGGRQLDGLRVVLDCAHGSASAVAPAVFAAAGADVTVLNAQPDGRNINEGCGSTHPEALQRAVVEHMADAGLAFDGDADRVLAIDAAGQLVDGDQLIALLAVDRGLAAVVVTVMTNLGFRHAMARHGIEVVETPVGDRNVLEALDKGGWALGGEQSGHIIFRDLATTGDGLLTGLQVLDVMRRTGRPLADLAAVMTRLPQVLRNVRVPSLACLDQAEELWAEVRAVAAELGEDGRVLVRPSGTEPLVRVMVEATTAEAAGAATERLCAAVVRTLGSAEGC